LTLVVEVLRPESPNVKQQFSKIKYLLNFSSRRLL
jgi:hypothetical protein